MEQVRFSAANGKPRLWFRCMVVVTPECVKVQTISCSQDWRALIPLARTEALYHELKESHQTYEGVHDYWRDRYKVAADTLGVRPKVVSIDWHRLRANVACLIDWLRIGAKQGWLGSARSARREGERRFQKARHSHRRALGKEAREHGPRPTLRAEGSSARHRRGATTVPAPSRCSTGYAVAGTSRKDEALGDGPWALHDVRGA